MGRAIDQGAPMMSDRLHRSDSASTHADEASVHRPTSQTDQRAADAAARRMAGGKTGKPAANEPYPPGTEVWVPRTGGYHHAAVYIGNQEVVHVFAEPMGAAKALLEGKPIVNVLRSPLSTFLDGASISSTKKGPSAETFPHDQIVQRALSHVGQAWRYNPLTHNCQHFTSSMVSGVAFSPEAQAIEDAWRNLPGKIEHGVESMASHAASGIASGAQQAGHAAEHAAASAAHSASDLGKEVAQKLKFW